MPVPVNGSAATATVISTLPFSVTEDVADQPSTTELWYTYVGTSAITVVGGVAWANIAGTYLPKTYVYTGSPSALVVYRVNGVTTGAFYVPVSAGTTYYFRVIQAGATSPLGDALVFTLQGAPTDAVPSNHIIACEEDAAFPTPLLDGGTDNGVLQYLANFPIAARGAQMAADGTLLCDDDGNSLAIFDANLQQLYAGLPSYYGFIPSNVANTDTLFYLSYVPSFGAASVIRTLGKDGSETGEVWTLPANSGAGMTFGVSNDGTTLYYSGKSSAPSSATHPVHVFDLVGNTALPDLVADLGDRVQGQLAILVFADDSILVPYTNVTNHWYANRYDAAGTLLNTYDYGTWRNDGERIAPGGTSFWVKLLNPAGGTQIKFQEIRVSDGVVLQESLYDAFSDGPSQINYRTAGYTPETAVPVFGLPTTCTFFVTFAAINGGDIIPPTPAPSAQTRTDPIRRVRQAPHLWDGTGRHRLIYPGFQLLVESGAPRETDQPLTFFLQWSDDGGHTWSNLHELQGSDPGQYRTRFWWRRLGQARDRVFRVINSDDAKIVLIDALLEPDPERGAH